MMMGSFEEFMQCMSMAPVMTGDGLLVVSDEERQQYMSELAAHNGNCFVEGVTVPVESCLTGPQLLRYHEHVEHMQRKSGVDGAYVTDLEQNVGWVSGGPFTPGLVTHGKVVSISREKIFTPKEHLAIVGQNFEV